MKPLKVHVKNRLGIPLSLLIARNVDNSEIVIEITPAITTKLATRLTVEAGKTETKIIEGIP